MTGTWLNVAGILLGGAGGLLSGRNLSPAWQQRLRLLLVALTVLVGFSMVWAGLRAPPGNAAKQLGIALLALMLGSLTGHLLRLQAGLGWLVAWLGRPETPAGAPPPPAPPLPHHFAGAVIFFVANPLGLVGAVTEGATGNWHPLGLKAVLDGLAALGFSATLGRPVLLLAVPVLAVQGTLTLAARAGRELLNQPAMTDSLGLTGGFIVICAAVVILGLRRVPLANYLPALVYAPLLTALLG